MISRLFFAVFLAAVAVRGQEGEGEGEAATAFTEEVGTRIRPHMPSGDSIFFSNLVLT